MGYNYECFEKYAALENKANLKRKWSRNKVYWVLHVKLQQAASLA